MADTVTEPPPPRAATAAQKEDSVELVMLIIGAGLVGGSVALGAGAAAADDFLRHMPEPEITEVKNWLYSIGGGALADRY